LHTNAESAIVYYDAFPPERKEEHHQKISSFSANLTVPTVLGFRKEQGNVIYVYVGLNPYKGGDVTLPEPVGIFAELRNERGSSSEWNWGLVNWVYSGPHDVYWTRVLIVDPGDSIHMSVKLTGTTESDSEKVYHWMYNCTVTSGRGNTSYTIPLSADSPLNHIVCPVLWMQSSDVPPSEGKIEVTDIMAFDEHGAMLDLYSKLHYEHSSYRHDHDTPNVLFEKTGSPTTATNVTLSWSPPLSVKD